MQFHINYHYIHIHTYLNITSYTYKIHIYMCMCIYIYCKIIYIYNHTAMLQAHIDVWIIHDYPTTYAKIATSESSSSKIHSMPYEGQQFKS